MSVLRVGIVGTGFLARTRVRCWRRVHGVAIELSAVAGSSRANADAFAAEHGIAGACDDAAALFSADVDLVDLCVPNDLHHSLGRESIAAGRDLLCTKPLAVDAEQACELVDDADAAGTRLLYGENWLFAPAFAKAVELTSKAEGTIRELRGWESHSGSHAAYADDTERAGGGALMRLGAHPIGAMLHLKRLEGAQPFSVIADLAPLDGVEHYGCACIAFDDGSRALAIGSDHMQGGMQSRLVVLADDHHLECNLSPHDLLRAYTPSDGTFGDAYVMEKVAGQAGWSTPLPDEDWSSGQQGLVQAAAEACALERPFAGDGALAVSVLRVIEAAYLSAREGRRVRLGQASSR